MKRAAVKAWSQLEPHKAKNQRRINQRPQPTENTNLIDQYPPTPAKQRLALQEDVPLRSMCHTVPSMCQRAGHASEGAFIPGLPFAFWLWAVAPLALRPSSLAAPKLCLRLFLTGFRRTVFGPATNRGMDGWFHKILVNGIVGEFPDTFSCHHSLSLGHGL